MHCTGVDPSINVFGELDASGRLDATDAVFVDAIHTNRSLVPVGHVDFYPNGGVSQPGCPDPDPTSEVSPMRLIILNNYWAKYIQIAATIVAPCTLWPSRSRRPSDSDRSNATRTKTSRTVRAVETTLPLWGTPYLQRKTLHRYHLVQSLYPM